MSLTSKDFYQFEPYLYGSCSFEVYGDLIALSDEKMIDETKIPPFSWNYYKTAPKGGETAKNVSLDKNIFKKLQEIKN